MSTREQRQAVNRKNKREREKRADIAGRKPQRDAAYQQFCREQGCSFPLCPCQWHQQRRVMNPAPSLRVVVREWERLIGNGVSPEMLRRVEFAHAISKAKGQKSDDYLGVGLCRFQHQERRGCQNHNPRFWEENGVDIDAIRAELLRAYSERA